MKKIDLHIHTLNTDRDVNYEFSQKTIERYVLEKKLDVIAITNHNCFDISQFQTIKNKLPNTMIFPGLEVDIGIENKGHLIVISNGKDILKFSEKCEQVNKELLNVSYLHPDKFIEIFGNLDDYLLIPHYLKKPQIDKSVLEIFNSNIFCGEVTSQKKFCSLLKNKNEITPLIFSDLRMSTIENKFNSRQTYLDINESSFKNIKRAILEKKVFLSEKNGNTLFPGTSDDLKISTGLNVILGKRSSGKTFTLNKIVENIGLENIKYIEQFSLVETNDENKNKKLFNDQVQADGSIIKKEYLKEFSKVIDDISEISLENNKKKIDKYISSLKTFAEELDKQDAFSKTPMFSETQYEIIESSNDNEIIQAIILLIEDKNYRNNIEKYINREKLVILLKEIINLVREKEKKKIIKLKINGIINEIQKELQFNAAIKKIEQVNFYEILLEKRKIDKFETIVNKIQQEKEIQSIPIFGYKIIENRKRFNGAGEMKNQSHKSLSFKDAFLEYSNPYHFMQKLKLISGLDKATFFEYFVNIEYKVQNKYNCDVSGGERAEFNLLNKINDARQYDLLLIDEPEASFDNLFLKDKVNEIIIDLSKDMPVVIVTHNNTVGASIDSDYLLYTERQIIDKKAIFKTFVGKPTDFYLTNCNDETEKRKTESVFLDNLEAGNQAYEGRKNKYELLGN